MNDKIPWLIAVGVVILIIGFFQFGSPDKIRAGVPGIIEGEWNTANSSIENPVPISTPQTSPYINEAVQIRNLSSQQKLYVVGHNLAINFDIINHLGLPYAFIVEWWSPDGSRRQGWSNASNNTFFRWSSWYQATINGTWEAHVLIEYTYDNRSYTDDDVISLMVRPVLSGES